MPRYAKALRRKRQRILQGKITATCPICGQVMMKGQKINIDHKVPRSRGGRGTADNLQVVHAQCNQSKGDQIQLISYLN